MMIIDSAPHLSLSKLMDLVNSATFQRSSPAAGGLECRLFLSLYSILVVLMYSFYNIIMYLYSKKHWRPKPINPRTTSKSKFHWLILMLLLANTA